MKVISLFVGVHLVDGDVEIGDFVEGILPVSRGRRGISTAGEL